MRREIHLFEPSGYAGPFQHACRLAALLSHRGVTVILHTGHEHEDVDFEGLELCTCSWWPRWRKAGPARSAGIAARCLSRTLRHLDRAVPEGGVLHVQGIAAAGGLTFLALRVGRRGGRRVVYSPHDTFSRRGRLDEMVLRLALRLPDAVIVHSRADVELLRGRGIHAHYAPLVQLVPRPSERERQRWRSEWGAGPGVTAVLFAGFIRPERRLDLLIRAAASWPPDRKLVVVGPDRGAWSRCHALAMELGVELVVRVEFVRLEEFAAAISAADVVVAPHDKASQSGVLSLANQLAVPAVAAATGGLGELATATFSPGDAHDLNRAIAFALAGGVQVRGAVDEELAVDAHLLAYGGES